MGIFDRLFGRKNTDGMSYAPLLSGYAPIFSQFGTDIFASDVVQQAISCIAKEMSKLRPMHVRKSDKNSDIGIPNSKDIQKVLDRPNKKMTKTEFLEKITWLLFLNYNAFIVPTWLRWKDRFGMEHRKLSELYPINPSAVVFMVDKENTTFVEFSFANGNKYTLPYSSVIHLKHNFGVNEYMGGNENGQPDNSALLKTLQLNKDLLDTVARNMKYSAAINGIIKYKTMMDKNKMETAILEIEEKLRKGESGFLPMDLSADYMPLSRQLAFVDDATLKFIDEKILRHFGVPLCILKGDYTKAQYEAFYQSVLEPLVHEYSEAFTRVLFNDNELDRGNCIEFMPKELIFMSVEQTLEMVTLLSNTGALYENEKRAAFGLPPLEALEGKRYMSLNWIDAENADAYQVGKGKKENGEDE